MNRSAWSGVGRGVPRGGCARRGDQRGGGESVCGRAPPAAARPPLPVPPCGWLDWRGPQQNGTSTETGLPDKWTLGGANELWTIDLARRRHAGDRQREALRPGLPGAGARICRRCWSALDAETGKKLWEQRFNDFLSDIVYDRYAIGSPCRRGDGQRLRR